MKQEMIDFAKLLKENGFTIFVYKYENANYFSFSKNGKFGYVQSSRGDVSFINCHVPTRDIGTGYGVETNGALSLENALSALNIPKWVSSRDKAKTKNYNDVSHFLKSNIACSIMA